jgi:hypothetical protein
MVLSASFLALMVSLLPAPQAQPDDILGPKKVNVQNAAYSQVPSTMRKLIGPATIGEEVTVTGYEGSFAKVKRADGIECYIARSALIPSADYKKSPANEQQMAEMKGQGYEAGRFDPETEAKYKKDKGPEMEKAFANVDRWEARQGWITDKMALAKRMEAFQKNGRLAEFSTVK